MPLGTAPMFIHYVYDMARATQFYCEVFDVEMASGSPGWTLLDFGTFNLALHILSPTHLEEDPLPHAGLNLLVGSIEEMQIRIEEHGGELKWLKEPQAGVPVRVASFTDCEGNGFELRQDPTLQ